MFIPLAFVTMPGPVEWLIIAALGLLFFGKRLPEVGRGLGRGILEFRKGLKGVQDEVENAGEDEDPKKITEKKESTNSETVAATETVEAKQT